MRLLLSSLINWLFNHCTVLHNVFLFSVFASFWFLALQMMWFHSMLRSIKARNNHYSCTYHFKMSILHWKCPKSIWNCIQISRTQLVESSVVSKVWILKHLKSLFPIFMLLHETIFLLWYPHLSFVVKILVRYTQVFAPKFKQKYQRGNNAL